MMYWYLYHCWNLQHYPVVGWLTESILVSLAIWLSHYFSVFLTVGSMVMMDLRVLGWAAKKQTITQVADLYAPWMWIGLSVLFVSGFLMLASDSSLYCQNIPFGINILVTILAAGTGVVIRKMVPRWDLPTGTPLIAKIVAGVALLLWLATILSAVEVPQWSDVP